MKDLVQLFRQRIGWWTQQDREPTRIRRVFRSADLPGPHRVSEWRKRQIREREESLSVLALLLSALHARESQRERLRRAMAAERKRMIAERKEVWLSSRRRFKLGESQIVDRLRGYE